MIDLRTMPARTLPSDQDNSGRTLADEEIAAVTAALRSGTLTSTKGEWVRTLESGFASLLGVDYAYACASGTGAIHCAIAALDPEPGDEIVTTPITDMGALAPILYQGAIPVFADVDPATYNVTASTIESCISDRTKAIVVTHLFGNPCEMDAIMKVAERRGIPVIEDCAQSFLATHNGRYTGTIGRIGCFSLQQGKHITTGEGGLVVTNDPSLARRIYLFINKAWGYGDANPDHYFLALNYRMSELAGSVGAAQLAKLPGIVARRRDLATSLTEQLDGLDEISPPAITPDSEHSYWKYAVRTTDLLAPQAVVEMARFLKERGIVAVPRYIQKPAFMCEVFQKRRTFGASGYPLSIARNEALDYRPERYPGAFSALERVLVVPWNECYTFEDVAYIAEGIRAAAHSVVRGEGAA